nr:hypothetical protein [Tanacetum cinerariifolium]
MKWKSSSARSIPPRIHRLNKDVRLTLALPQIIVIVNCTKREVENHLSLISLINYSWDDLEFTNSTLLMTGFSVREWLKFNNHEFSADSRKEFRKRYSEISMKEVERPEALAIDEFGALHEGIALLNLNQFCHVSYSEEDRTFTS